ncbi:MULTISPECIES: ATP-binding protein [unclassified Streptomyces]|uniref:ATP-binding protein n=1 Tax=unclassified Streptomyces TaxID=2593676 RepID=UPI000DC23D69|nr:ATP-binding protein [Streptomyces sp. PsTaAH-137]RAJ75245.1 anti-sigma regulatory factor (Ser/Thr protein kinase) [Streptomyces sp. PsTaAH-137]
MVRAEVGDGRTSGIVEPVSALFEGSAEIAEARHLARGFLADVQTTLGVPVSERVTTVVQLVVSELVTNAHRHASGPCLLTLEVNAGAVEVTVWDGEAAPPVAQAADPQRLGQHGLEIVMAVCRSFEVHREPVGKRIKGTVVLADDPGGHASGRLL